MAARTTSTILSGAAAGLAASALQVMVGKAEEILILPSHEDANIAPRLMDRLAEGVHTTLSPRTRWALGTGFHLDYGAVWGVVYALAIERRTLEPLVGGILLGGLIYTITFSDWGLAVRTHTERPSTVRTRSMELVAVSVALTFGLATALLYEPLAERSGGQPMVATRR